MTATVGAPLARERPEPVGLGDRGPLGGRCVLEADGQLDEPAERRRTEPAADLQLGVVEGVGIAAGDGLDRRVVGLVALDDRPSRPVAAAGPPDGLGQELVGPFGGPLVGQVQRDVGADDADEGDLRDVEALGDQAGADEDVEPSVA